MEILKYITPFLIFFAATFFLVKSADRFVEEIEKIGESLRLPHFFTGVLFVAIGTSLPELVTAIIATLAGEGELVVGNVLGSDIANIMLGLGAVVFLTRKTMTFKMDVANVHLPILLMATFMTSFMMMDKIIARSEGLILLSLMVVYLWFLYSQKDATPAGEQKKDLEWKNSYVLFSVLSLVVVLISSNFVVSSVLQIATIFGFTSAALGATLIAIGTSLPEMIVVYSALKKGNADMAVGNILGSNIFNLVLILGAAATIRPLVVSDISLTILLPFFVGSVLVYWPLKQNKRIAPHEGLALTIAYLFFVGKLYGFV